MHFHPKTRKKIKKKIVSFFSLRLIEKRNVWWFSPEDNVVQKIHVVWFPFHLLSMANYIIVIRNANTKKFNERQRRRAAVELNVSERKRQHTRETNLTFRLIVFWIEIESEILGRSVLVCWDHHDLFDEFFVICCRFVFFRTFLLFALSSVCVLRRVIKKTRFIYLCLFFLAEMKYKIIQH